MPALPEYKTRVLLENHGVPLAHASFHSAMPEILPIPVVFLKAQIPGATSRAGKGLVRRASTGDEVYEGLKELLLVENCQGVLVADAVDIQKEFYAACLLDYGTGNRLPGGVILFSADGGSGIEGRTGSLTKIYFSLLNPPSAVEITAKLPEVSERVKLGEFLHRMVNTFIGYKLVVLETNPIAVLRDGKLIAVDCRSEYEKQSVSSENAHLFLIAENTVDESTPLERAVEAINKADPAGTGFFRSSREKIPKGAIAVATNLCGGGGKMLWEMATGGRSDIFTLNESDTSGGLSAFKSYRILRVIMSQPEARVLILTGSGMAFQSQFHLASAVWKALRESSTPLPCLLRFGGTDQEKAMQLMNTVEKNLPVKIKSFIPEIFPNAMIEHLEELAANPRINQEFTPALGEPAFEISTPPARFIYHPERNPQGIEPSCVKECPTGFLLWRNGRIAANPDAKCIGCLVCETVSLLQGNGELTIELDLDLDLPGEV
jgi:succinyl-CoA synthetase beta subunit